MRIRKCASCGGKIDRICFACPVCGSAFSCKVCGITLTDSSSNMCSDCKYKDNQAKLEMAQAIACATQQLCDDLNSSFDDYSDEDY